MRAHRNDSSFVVLRAAAAIDKIAGHRVLRVHSYQRTDSGTVVSMFAICGHNYDVICFGGGGLVLVDSLGKARVLQLYQ